MRHTHKTDEFYHRPETIRITLRVAAAVKSRHEATTMKVAIIFFLLTTTTVKEKDACQESQRPIRYHHQPDHEPVLIQRPIHIQISQERTSIPRQESITMTDINRARIFHSQEDESQWEKDHEPLVTPETGKLSLRTKFDHSILDLHGEFGLSDLKNPFLDTAQEKSPFGDNNQIKNPFVDSPSVTKPLRETDPECVELTTYRDHYFKITKTDLPTGNSWDDFFAGISNCHMYPEDSDKIIKALLDDMFKLKVTKVENFGGKDEKKDKAKGTQFKLKLTFENGKQALFKPMRFGIEYEKHPDQFYHSELERPNAEIALFYLDKLLGFRTAVPAVDRVFSISTELKEAENHGVTYFTSPANNLCFYGTCMQYCDTSHALCGVQDKIRGSVQAWLPAHTNDDDPIQRRELYLDIVENPYTRKYKFGNEKTDWQGPENMGYCKTNVLEKMDFKAGRRMLDVVDFSILDY